jgi:uncharacterized protein (DUF362 family)
MVIDSRRQQASTLLVSALTRFLSENPGGEVLIKTSTAGRRDRSHEVSDALLELIVRTVVEQYGKGVAILADGPAVPDAYEDECRRFGWDQIATRYSVAIEDLNRGDAVEIVPGWPIARRFLSASLVINLTKAKTHRRFGTSLAEKALLGTLSGARLGFPKLRKGHNHVPWLAETVLRHSPPIFSVIDGVEGIEGEGPLAGAPSKSHFLCFGTGVRGPDIRSTIEMGFHPAMVPMNLRPLPRDEGSHRSIDWTAHRVTEVNFLPSKSCAWLHKSVAGEPSERRFRALLEGAQACWPRTT